MQLQGLDLRKLYPFDSEINFLAQGDDSWESFFNFFVIYGLNIGQILRLTLFAQDDHVGVMTFYKGD